jgi:hypothetical protein
MIHISLLGPNRMIGIVENISCGRLLIKLSVEFCSTTSVGR